MFSIFFRCKQKYNVDENRCTNRQTWYNSRSIVCASFFIHCCMQRKNNENIPILHGKVKITCSGVSDFDIVS